MKGPRRADERFRVAVVEDHVLQRERTVELLSEDTNLSVVASVGTLPQLVQWLAGAGPHERPHLVLLDLVVDYGRDADPETVARLVEASIQVLVVSAMVPEALVRSMLRAGVAGLVTKRDPAAVILAAVRTVLSGRTWVSHDTAALIAADAQRPALSDQEERALLLYASGLTMEGVAANMGVKRDTVKTYISRAKAKYAALGRPVRSKTDLLKVAISDGYLDIAAADRQASG